MTGSLPLLSNMDILCEMEPHFTHFFLTFVSLNSTNCQLAHEEMHFFGAKNCAFYADLRNILRASTPQNENFTIDLSFPTMKFAKNPTSILPSCSP